MTATTSPQLGHIHALLAEHGYEVSDTAPDTLTVRDTASGVSLQAVLEGDILFLSLVCIVVPESAVTPEIMGRMLAGTNGISTAAFKLYEAGAGKVAIVLNNFCKLENMGSEDEDDILSCVHFLLVDVVEAKSLLSDLKA
jgi:hypothetical protein